MQHRPLSGEGEDLLLHLLERLVTGVRGQRLVEESDRRPEMVRSVYGFGTKNRFTVDPPAVNKRILLDVEFSRSYVCSFIHLSKTSASCSELTVTS